MTFNQSQKDKTDQETTACLDGDSCHWVIEPPNGPTSLGKCKKCGKEKEFRNSFEYNTWHGEKPVDSQNKSKNSKDDDNDDEKSSK
ncbi:MAG: hypothetical protein CL764_01295 [Chloroflexi bacterium]|nr:hypothetical protein [Chloroflexota bacterium]|tara:strand:- start:501 stop:758 length:258 start_codon:yes stop_codon:yes gene_type:complete